MKKPLAIMRGESLFTVKAYPVGHPNPSKFRYAMYRDGVMVGAARSKEDAMRRINAGYYDPEPGGAK